MHCSPEIAGTYALTFGEWLEFLNTVSEAEMIIKHQERTINA